MNDPVYIAICMIIMAGTTYLLRVTPLIIFRKKIRNRFVQSFLYYVPYAVLAAMTFPAIFTATGNTAASLIGTGAALVLAFFRRSLLIVALGAAAAAFIAGLVI